MEKEQLEIKRFAYAPTGTFGEMLMPDGTRLYSVEQPWRDNKTNESCIPEGYYQCEPRKFNKGGYDAIHITDVPNRAYIMFHRGNNSSDVAGCIATGRELAWVDRLWAVGNSVAAFETLMEYYGNLEFELSIKGFNPRSDSYNVHENAENIDKQRGGVSKWAPIPKLLEQHNVLTKKHYVEQLKMKYLIEDEETNN